MGQRDVQRASFGPSNTSAGLTLSYFIVCVWVLKNTNLTGRSLNVHQFIQFVSNPGKTIERRPYPWSISNDHHIIQWQNDKTIKPWQNPCVPKKIDPLPRCSYYPFRSNFKCHQIIQFCVESWDSSLCPLTISSHGYQWQYYHYYPGYQWQYYHYYPVDVLSPPSYHIPTDFYFIPGIIGLLPNAVFFPNRKFCGT